MALSQELVKQCRPSQENPTMLASRTRTSQDEVDIHNHTGKRRQSTNTTSTLNQARSSKHVSFWISCRTVRWRKISASDHHKTNSVPFMTVAPSSRIADTHGEPLLWTMRGLDAWYSLPLSSRSTSAGKCLENKRQIPQASPQYFDSYAATTQMLPWRENAVTAMKRLSAQREKRMKNCRLS